MPGSLVRLRQREPARLVVENRLDQETTVHRHGIRLPNAMDGVPGLTQPPIRPGESFIYEFTPPDAGTFWYHPHANSLEQLGRGLTAAVIVEARQPVAVDSDLVWMLSDWRLTEDGGNRMEPGCPAASAIRCHLTAGCRRLKLSGRASASAAALQEKE